MTNRKNTTKQTPTDPEQYKGDGDFFFWLGDAAPSGNLTSEEFEAMVEYTQRKNNGYKRY